jgi:hypothetical protein
MAWIPAVAGAAGSIIGGLIGQSGQESTNATNIRLQQNQQSWEERMSNTAIQRRQSDLRAAGINPIIAGGYGGAADVPNVAPARVENAGAFLGAGVQAAGERASSAAQVALINAQVDKTSSEAELNRALVPKAQAETTVATGTAQNLGVQYQNLNIEQGKLYQEVKKLASEAAGAELDTQQKIALNPILQKLADIETKRQQLGLPRLKNEADAQGSWWMKKVSPYLPDVLKSSGAAAGSAAAIRSVVK